MKKYTPMTYMRLVFGALLCLSQPLLLAKPGKYDVDPAAVSLAPAVINVTDEVINEDLMALTATSGEIPSALSESFAFGPLTFRTMFQTGADSADTLVPGGFSNGTRIAFDWFKDDFWKGASARVYRVRDGKLVKIRESEVVDSASSGWVVVAPDIRNQRTTRWHVVSPDRTKATLGIGRGWR